MFNNLLNNFFIQNYRLIFKKQFTLLFIFTFLTISYTHAQWIQQTSGVSDDLRDMSFINQNTGWIVGENGSILKTTNGGDNWETQNSGTTQNLRSVFFWDENLGFIAGTDDLLATTNGGATWVYQWTLLTPMNDIDFYNENTGWAVGTVGKILHTTNGGTNWEQQTSGTTEHFSKMDFLDSDTGYVVGSNGTIRKTTNGGNSWLGLNSGTSQDLYGVDFINPGTAWVVGYNGTIKKTTNYGLTFVTQDAGTTRDFNSVDFEVGLTGLRGWVLSPYKLYNSTNGGITWTEQDMAPNTQGIGQRYFTLNNTTSKYSELSSTGTIGFVDFSEAITAYIVGDSGTIQKTTNGGVFVSNNNTTIPDMYALHQNYPNPFNPGTTITFDLPKSGFASLIIYDVLGREVAILLNKRLTAGSYIGKWNAEDYNSGVYFYRLTAGDYVETRKMLLVK